MLPLFRHAAHLHVLLFFLGGGVILELLATFMRLRRRATVYPRSRSRVRPGLKYSRFISDGGEKQKKMCFIRTVVQEVRRDLKKSGTEKTARCGSSPQNHRQTWGKKGARGVQLPDIEAVVIPSPYEKNRKKALLGDRNKRKLKTGRPRR